MTPRNFNAAELDEMQVDLSQIGTTQNMGTAARMLFAVGARV